MAELVAAVSNNDAKHPTNPDQDSVARCHQLLLSRAGITASDIDAIYAHGTGTRAKEAQSEGATGIHGFRNWCRARPVCTTDFTDTGA
ncbi:hypothetical protein [Photorhabdus sp. RM157S]|uniref:hypothetical protein n=1 Tax=Photorhabdus TaxID=29487 RepID=UPI00069B8669|nr:hypothetical protein [Photorhabdus thracensis]